MTTHERTYVRPVDLIGDAIRGTDDIVAVSDGRTVTVRPLLDLVSQDVTPTALPHFALFLTRDKVAALGVDAYTLRRSHSLHSVQASSAVAKRQCHSQVWAALREAFEPFQVKLLTVLLNPSVIVVMGFQPSSCKRDVSGAFLEIPLSM